MKASDTSKLLKLLAEHGEEKVGSVISRLRGLTGSAPQIEQSTAQVLPAIYENAPALEGELVGDLATQTSKKVLPDVEGQLVGQKLITQSEQAIPNIDEAAKTATSNLGGDIPGIPASKPFSMTDAVNNLSPTQKAVAGAGIVGAAALPLMNGNDETPPSDIPPVQAKAVQNTVSPDSEEASSDDGIDTIENPLTAQEKGEPIDATSLLNLTKGQTTQVPLTQTSQADQFNKQLEAARQADAQHQLLFGMLKASQMGGAALGQSSRPADTSYADTELARPNANVANLKTSMDMREEAANIQEKQQKRDPSSLTSKLYQDMLKQLNPNMNVAGLSAEQVEKVFPQIGMIINKREATEARVLQAKIHEDTMKLARSNKLDEQDAKHLEEYRKARDPMLASIRSPLGKEVSRYTQSEHALNLIKGVDDLSKVTPMQKRELAVALATMISPGLPHEETISKLDQSTLNDEIASMVQKITGSPASTNTKGLTAQLKTSVMNQRNISGDYIAKHQKGVDEAFAPHIAKNPNIYDRIAKTTNYDAGLNEIQPIGAEKTTTVNKPSDGGVITIRSKKTGTVKTLPAESAAKYLNNPDFERVQ